MLSSQYRLKGNKVFQEVEKKGKVSQFPFFGVAILSRGDDKPSLFGIIVSTKISKLAVTRNKIKRAISESIRQNHSFVKKGFDVIFLVKGSIANKSTSVIMNETKNALQEVGLFG